MFTSNCFNPFCAGHTVWTEIFGRLGIKCEECPAMMRGDLGDDEGEELLEAWNRWIREIY